METYFRLSVLSSAHFKRLVGLPCTVVFSYIHEVALITSVYLRHHSAINLPSPSSLCLSSIVISISSSSFSYTSSPSTFSSNSPPPLPPSPPPPPPPPQPQSTPSPSSLCISSTVMSIDLFCVVPPFLYTVPTSNLQINNKYTTNKQQVNNKHTALTPSKKSN